MIDRGRQRTSPRQAIVALLEPAIADWAVPIAVPLALDVIAAMIAVNGVTFYATSRSIEQASPFVPVLPAGIAYIVPPARTRLSVAAWFARRLAEREFEYFVLVSGDAIGVSPKLLATALSVLKSEESVSGLTPNEIPYLVGLQASRILSDSKRFGSLLDALVDGREHAPGQGSIESRPRLRELASLSELLEAAGAYGDCLPRSLESART